MSFGAMALPKRSAENQMSMKRIVICDDHQIIREAVGNRLGRLEGLELVGEAADGNELLEIAPGLEPDLILIDLEMPGRSGISTIRKLRETMSEVPVVVLSAHGEPDVVDLAIDSGATGFLLKSATTEEVAAALGSAIGGKPYLGKGVEAGGKQTQELERLSKLTPRELQILGLLADGMRARGIAEELNVQPATVYTHVRNTVQKLGVDTQTQAVALALRYSFLHDA